MDNNIGEAYHPGPPEMASTHPKMNPDLPFLTCFCQGHCPGGHHNGTCRARAGAKCFAAVEKVFDAISGQEITERTYGCLPPDGSGGMLQCKGHLVPHLNPTSIACCSDSNLCNQHLRPMYQLSSHDTGFFDEEENSFQTLGATLDHPTSLALLISLTICFVIFVILVAFWYLRYKKREDHRQKYVLTARTDPDSYVKSYPGTLHDLVEQSTCSGSGLPLLVQRTIAKQLQWENSIGKGRYGEVWLAKWRGENVAVKVFYTKDEASWFRETEIYQTVLMRHTNLLGFIAADIKGNAGWTQMILITDYHQHGSLYDFLNQNIIDVEGMVRMCYSIICGLTHLHTEIYGTNGKPAIAHRDIKSRNILVKDDGTCAIADFGLAVRFDSKKNKIDIGEPNSRVGTIRYMSPENLDKSINTDAFISFLQSDMYSLGLVFWEIARRTAPSEKVVMCYEYQLPYFEYVNPDPSFEEMLTVVCMKELRPSPCPRWHMSPPLTFMSQLMAECWHHNPNARLSALRVKKSMANAFFNESSKDDSIQII